MSTTAQAEKHVDSLSTGTPSNRFDIEPQIDASDPEKQSRVSDPEAVPHVPHDGSAATGAPGIESSNGTTNLHLTGWRLYTVQLA